MLQIGVDKMLQNLEWTGKDAFEAAEPREWKVDGRVVGLTRNSGKLTFVTVEGAGHMVGAQHKYVRQMIEIACTTGTV